jgi:hypothetical protein
VMYCWVNCCFCGWFGFRIISWVKKMREWIHVFGLPKYLSPLATQMWFQSNIIINSNSFCRDLFKTLQQKAT